MPDSEQLLSALNFTDVTPSPEQLAMLEQASWAAVLSSVSRGIVHELRNPLQAISLSAQTVPHAPSDEDVQFLAGAVERSSAQLAKTIALLSQLYRPADEPAPVLLPDVITFVMELQRFQRTLAAVPVEVSMPPAVPPVVGVDARLSHALMCLVTNAKEAIGVDADGAVTLRIVPEAEEVALLVEDNGPGVDPDVAARLFHPFVTSKPGRLGIGLAAARALLQPVGARVDWMDTGTGRGATTFAIRLKVWPTAIEHPL